MFTTTTWRAPDPDDPEKVMHLGDGIWIDLDARKDRGETLADAVVALRLTANKLRQLDIPLECCSVFATGSKGFHIFMPLELLLPGGVAKADIQTARTFPRICRELVINESVTDQTDLSLYCGGKGHLIRQVNVKRDNGAFKVPVAWSEALQLDQAGYAALCGAPRPWIEPAPVTGAVPMAATAWAFAKEKANKQAPRPRPAMTPRQQEVERPKILGLLRKIDPAGLDYRDWLRVGCALRTWGTDDALDLWIAFSQQDRKRYRPGTCESRWDGLTPGAVGIGTLVLLVGGSK